MPTQESIKPDPQQQVLDLVMNLIRTLRTSSKIKSDELIRLFSEDHWQPDLLEERELYHRIVQILNHENPQLSVGLIYSILVGHVVKNGAFYKEGQMPIGEIEAIAKKKISDLFRYDSSRDIDIPLAYLTIDETPFPFGNVTFHSLSCEDKHGEWWEKIKVACHGYPDSIVFSFARVVSTGNQDLSLDYAFETVRETLLIFRGLGFPIVTKSVGQLGILNEFTVLPEFPYRIQNVKENIRLEGSSDVVIQLGGPQRYFGTKMILEDVPAKVLSAINSLLLTKQETKPGEMAAKLLSGLRWIGEATKPDSLPARYIKLATALEFLVGGESNTFDLSTKGITAAIAERSAFVLGKTCEQRVQIDREVRKFYGIRSKIVHGNEDEVPNADFEKFGKLVRQIAFALCEELVIFDNLLEFQRWIVNQRYS